MIKSTLRWEAYSSDDRNRAIEAIKSTISNSHGSILHFNMFSDLALALSVEIAEGKIQMLHKALSVILTISELEQHDLNIASEKEWLVYINISFSKGTGDLRQEIPAVPG